MLSLQDVGPELERDEHNQDGPDPQNKRRLQSGEETEPPSAKRLKAAENSKTAKLSRGPGKTRNSAAKAKEVDPEKSGKPMWSVVACLNLPKVSDLERVDIRPRLWASTREELVSTFVEISGSKCINNISWTSTDMPILILEGESVSVERPENVGDELYMDLTLIRDFVCTAERVIPQRDNIPSISAPTVDIRRENVSDHSSSPRPPIASIEPVPAIESSSQEQQPIVTSADATDIPLSVERVSASEPSTCAIVQIPKPNPKKARLKQPKSPEPLPQKNHPAPIPQRSKKTTGAKTTSSVLSSLRFKKIKDSPSHALPSKETSQVCSLEASQPLPTPSSTSRLPHSTTTDAIGPPEPGVTQILAPGVPVASPSQAQAGRPSQPAEPTPFDYLPPHSSQHPIPEPPRAPFLDLSKPDRRLTPDTPMSELETIINSQTDFKPTFDRYPDNRFLPRFDNLPHALAEKYGVPMPTSFAYQLVEGFKINFGGLGEVRNVEVGSGDVVAVEDVAGSRRVPNGVQISQPSVHSECCCSRFRYDRQCRACGLNSPVMELSVPLGDHSAQNPEGMAMEVDVERLAPCTPRGPRVRPTYPNDIPLVQRKPWGRGAVVRSTHLSSTNKQITRAGHHYPGFLPPSITSEEPTAVHIPKPSNGDALRPEISAEQTLEPPPKPVPVVIGNTVHQALGRQGVAMLVPNPPDLPNAYRAALHAPASTGKFHLPSYHVPHPEVPVLPPVTSATNEATKGLMTNEVAMPALPLPEQIIVKSSAVTSPSLKRKGKEKAQVPESSDDDEPLSLSIKRRRAAKKPKLDHGSSEDGRQALPMYCNDSTMPIPCSSKTKLEDLPVLIPTAQAPLENGVRVVGAGRKDVDQVTPVSISAVVKPVKRRGRPPNSMKPSSNVSQSATKPVPMPTGSEECQMPPPSLSALKPDPQQKLESQTKSTPPHSVPVRRENGVPSPIPDEIRALVDAYVNCMPVGVFAGKKYLQGFWGLKLAREEVGYTFMGFYRVSRVWECLSGGDGDAAKDSSKARVRWRFRMKWEPGGEDWQVRERDKLSSPWWNPTLKALGLSIFPQPDSEDSDDESTLEYRLARKRNPNFERRRCFFNQAFYSVLPLHLLAPVDAEIPDSTLPRGWHCEDCGKLNFRSYLRHRRCGSSYCESKPEDQGYAIGIDRLRDPQDALPLSLPLNELPSHVRIDARVQAWGDRMKTLVYRLSAGGGPVVAQHVFTSNLKELQRDASQLLNVIQIHVPLQRLAGDAGSNPYFTYFVGDDDGRKAKFVPWGTAPECLQRARDLMNNRGRKYGKRTAIELDIRRLEVRAWVTTGSKRGSDLLCAKQHCMVIMCLGCEAIMGISPKSTIASNDDQTRVPDLDKLIPMESFDPQESQPEVAIQPGEGVKMEARPAPGETQDQIHLTPAASAQAGAVVKKQKGEKTVLSVSLVHGDILVLEGDDFEYSIKRTGTSILLFGW